MQRYPYLLKQYQTWFVRMVIPPDVRTLIGKSIVKVATHERDIHRAATVAAPIIAGVQQAIATARAKLKPPIEVRVEDLAQRYRALQGVEAERFALAEVMKFALQQTGQAIPAYQKIDLQPDGMIVAPDSRAALQVRLITGKATPFLAHIEAWKKQVMVHPKTRDEYESAIREFVAKVPQPLEDLTGAHVQRWIDAVLDAGDDERLDALTVNKKLSGLRNYWHYLTKREIVGEERKPFHNRDVKNAAAHKKVKMLRYHPAEVVRLWQTAEADGNTVLADLIKIAAYTGGRREGIVCLTVANIKIDPDTGVRFMHTTGKTEAGDRDVPIHSAIVGLIERLVKNADAEGYLIPSRADNQYGIRGTLIGKEFAALKSKLGFGEAHDFHSIRRTVTHLLEAAECPEGVAKDIVGHKKLDITFGLYSGLTRIDQRARWLEKAIVYPA